MKYFFLIITSLFIASCSQKENYTKKDDTIINLEAKSGIISGTFNFGTFSEDSNSVALLTFKITNNGTEPLIGPVSLDGPGFTIAYQNCNSVAVKSSCIVKVSFVPKNKSLGLHSTNLMLSPIIQQLTATVEPTTVVPDSQFLLSSSIITNLDFGQLSDSQNILKTITIKNIGVSSTNSTVSLSSNFILSYDACSGKSIAKNSSCQVKVSLSGTGKSGLISGTLTYAGKSLSLSGEVITASSGSSTLFPNIVFIDGTNIIPEPETYDFGSLSGSMNKQLILTIKNSGTLAAAESSASLSDSSNFSIIFNQCLNKKLAINASCQLRILFSASEKSPNTYSTNLSFGGKTLALSALVQSSNPPPSSIITIIADTYNSNYSVNTKFISTDMGQTFTPMSFPNTHVIQEVVVSGNNILFREDGPDTVYLSTNNGQSYSLLSNPNSEITAAYMSGDKIVLSTFNSSFSTNTYYISLNLGQSFSVLNIPSNLTPVQKVILSGDKIYIQKAGSNQFGVSLDNGQNYEIKQSPNQILSQISISGDKIVVDTYPSDYSSRTSYISLDGGNSFQLVDLISKINNYQQPYLANGQLLITGSPMSVSISSDNGNSFSPIPLSSISNPNINQLFIFGN